MPATCNVMRCPNEAETVWTHRSDNDYREYAVCQAHLDALNSGAARQLDEDRWILMDPDDLAGGHEWLVDGNRLSIGQRVSDYASSDPQHVLHLEVLARRRGSDELEELDLVMTKAFAEQLRIALGRVLPGWD